MPNIKSAKQRVLISKINNASNRAAKTELKTMVKKFDAAVVAGGDAAAAAYKNAVKTIDQAAAKGIIHKNTAARKKSQLTRKLNAEPRSFGPYPSGCGPFPCCFFAGFG